MCPFSFFFFNRTAPSEIYTLSLHDALPISDLGLTTWGFAVPDGAESQAASNTPALDTRQHTQAIVRSRRCVRSDRKSTRLNSSHLGISYAVFCLKKKKKNIKHTK